MAAALALPTAACAATKVSQPAASPASADPLQAWKTNPAETVSADSAVPFAGQPSIRLQRDDKSGSSFSAISQSRTMDFSGHEVELRGHLRTQDVAGFAGLWLREDGVGGVVEFDNMASRHLSGTTPWTEYAVKLPINPKARTLVYGVLLVDRGTAWSDQPELFVDGKPISQAAHVEVKKTVFDTDREFEEGSRLKIDALSAQQIDDLVLLGEVWGFLKYFHPAITTGTKQWDFELFRILPRVLKAATREEANGVLVDWIGALGPVPDCSPCASDPPAGKVQSSAPVAWIRDQTRLGEALSRALVQIYRNRKPETQFYVSRSSDAGNPIFENELSYDRVHLPDPGFQLLAAYRFWAIIQYWYPHRNLLSEDWASVLRWNLSDVVLAQDDKQFDRALLKLIAHVGDTHTNLWSAIAARPPEGECQLPLTVRFVGDEAVVSEIARSKNADSAIRVGDVIRRLDGVPVKDLVERWSPYYAGSNTATRLRDIGRSMANGPCGAASLDVERDGRSVPVAAQRIPQREVKLATLLKHDLPGDTFRLLSPDVAYLKLSSVKSADVPGYVEAAKTTKGLIVDIRNYPSEFVVFSLGSLLVHAVTPFASFTRADLSNPGAFLWDETEKLEPAKPHYAGKIVVLIDEMSQSQSEYTTMALRAAPRARVIGSTTAGADGDVSGVPLPAGRRAAITGIGVFYPDRRPTQKVGIVADVIVKPTVRGIREGHDEVLERALREVLGSKPSDDELRKLYRTEAAAATESAPPQK